MTELLPRRLRDWLESRLLDWRWVRGTLLVLAAGAGVQQVLLSLNRAPGQQTHYNNFNIFVGSFFHLIHGQDLYAWYPAEHWDLYKYSPTFAAFMGPLAYFPDVVGLVLWNLINAGVLLYAIRRLPILDARARALMCWFLALEFLTSTQNSQCNVLIAGLIILAFDLLEQRRTAWAALAVVGVFYIKLFGIFAAVLFLLYPDRWRALRWSALWFVVLGLVPLLFVSPDQLQFLYRSWWEMLAADHSASTGLSVIGWLHSWFGLDPPKPAVVLVGAVVCLLPLVRVRAYAQVRFRSLFLASALIWMIIFNHKAESATFIIAMCGVAIWYFPQVRKTENLVLLGLAFLFTTMSPRLPDRLVEAVVLPYALKAVPCILVWFKITFELVFSPFARDEPPVTRAETRQAFDSRDHGPPCLCRMTVCARTISTTPG